VTQEVRIPDIGDVDEVEVIEICVAVGDTVGEDDPLIVIESDKASMDVPAGMAGRVASVDVAVGDQVQEGSLIVTLDTDSASGTSGDDDAPDEQAAAPATDDAGATAASGEEEASPAEKAPQPDDGSAEGADVEVRVPDIGEATNVEVIEVAVAEGDSVGPDDLLVVVESDKASMEIPAGQAGTVTGVHVQVGSEVVEGTLLATIRAKALASEPAPARSTPAAASPSAEERAAAEEGPSPEESPSAPKAPTAAGGDRERAAEQPTPETPGGERGAAEPEAGDGRKIYAGPAVRRLARELGVALAKVKGTGNRGRILKEDVKAFVKSAMTSGGSREGSGIPSIPAVDFSRFGPVEMQPMSRIRVSGAQNLHRSWLNLPHVTQFEEADVTELEEFRQTLKEEANRREVKITPLAFIIKACCYALQAFPTFNASLDPEGKNFVLKKYYHIGFAVDTPDGLVVPVIRDANKLGVWDLSAAVAELGEKARNGKLGLSDLQGGSFSISSLGNIGGTGFTPIINAPEVAILGVSRLVTRPLWNGEEFEPRKVLPLSLSYDHRAINGAEAGRFMAMLAELLADIRRLSL
jgi:pyruvate dehydrogenase E2 component (dihydrolipoamide acetyltransferase)